MASRKRRYRCSDCDWAGWRHRLQRQDGSPSSEQPFDARALRTREVWYFVVVTVAFVLFLGTVMKQCADEAPIPPDDVTHLEVSSLSRLPRI